MAKTKTTPGAAGNDEELKTDDEVQAVDPPQEEAAPEQSEAADQEQPDWDVANKAAAKLIEEEAQNPPEDPEPPKSSTDDGEYKFYGSKTLGEKTDRLVVEVVNGAPFRYADIDGTVMMRGFEVDRARNELNLELRKVGDFKESDPDSIGVTTEATTREEQQRSQLPDNSMPSPANPTGEPAGA